MTPPIEIYSSANAAIPDRRVDSGTIQEKTEWGTDCEMTVTPEGFQVKFLPRGNTAEYTEGEGKVLTLHGGRVAKPVRAK